MKFFIRLTIEILTMIFVVLLGTRVLSKEHPGVAGMVIVSVLVVALALRAATQSETIKDDAVQRRRLEEAFVEAAEEAGWPILVRVRHDRKIMTHYIENPHLKGLVNGTFYIETPLKEESLDEQTQLVDLLSPEEVDAFYGDSADNDTEKEVNTNDDAEE